MRIVLITGISRGIGRALAQRFLDNGDFVIGTSTTGVSDILHQNLIVFQLDLSDSLSIKNCVEKITKLNKKIDILINNAGIWSNNENDQVVHIDLLRKVLEVNLIGTIDFTEQLISLMQKEGHIMNISSSAGSLEQTHHSNYPDYKISKAALNMYTRTLAIRLNDMVTVSSVHPGWVKTDMGGINADIEPKEAAEDIFNLITSNTETGQFWFKGEKFLW